MFFFAERPKKTRSVEDVHSDVPDVDEFEQVVSQGGHRRVTHQFQAQVGGPVGSLEVDEDTTDGPGRLTGRPLKLQGLLKFRPAVDVDVERDETRLVIDGNTGRSEVPFEIHESRHVLPGHVNEDGLDDVGESR